MFGSRFLQTTKFAGLSASASAVLLYVMAQFPAPPVKLLVSHTIVTAWLDAGIRHKSGVAQIRTAAPRTLRKNSFTHPRVFPQSSKRPSKSFLLNMFLPLLRVSSVATFRWIKSGNQVQNRIA